MSEYDDTNRGALFKNSKKESENHPDYTGTINVGGGEFWLSAWIKESKAGAKYMSLSVKPKDAAPRQSREEQRKGERKRAAEGDEIPF